MKQLLIARFWCFRRIEGSAHRGTLTPSEMAAIPNPHQNRFFIRNLTGADPERLVHRNGNLIKLRFRYDKCTRCKSDLSRCHEWPSFFCISLADFNNAWLTAGSLDSSNRMVGPETLIAASGKPCESNRGTATQNAPSMLSSRSTP